MEVASDAHLFKNSLIITNIVRKKIIIVAFTAGLVDFLQHALQIIDRLYFKNFSIRPYHGSVFAGVQNFKKFSEFLLLLNQLLNKSVLILYDKLIKKKLALNQLRFLCWIKK